MTSGGKRTELLSHHEAINIALLDINKLQQVAAIHRIIIPKSLLANLKCHFTGLGAEHRALLRHLERYNIANRKLAQQVESFQSQKIRHMRGEGRSVLHESIECATVLESQVREVQQRVIENDKEIHRLKEEISHTREERFTYGQLFECSVDKLNMLMQQNIKRRERENTATQQLKEISSCSDRYMTDLEKLRQELDEEQQEYEQRVIDYETGRSELSGRLGTTTDNNVRLSKSLHEVSSEANELKDRAEGKRQEVARLERSIAEVANDISLLRSKRDGKVEALGRLEVEKQQVMDKMRIVKGEHEEMQRQLLEVIGKLDEKMYLIETENNTKEEEKIKLHDKLVEADMLEGAETKRLQELHDDLSCKRNQLLKQSSKVEEMKRAITNRNLQLNHCMNLILSSQRVQEAHLSKLNTERVRLLDDSENAVKLIGRIHADTKSIRTAHTALVSETLEMEKKLVEKMSALTETAKKLEEEVHFEKERKQELREACSKLQDFYHATELLHCHSMEAHAIRGRVLQEQTEEVTSGLQSLRLQEQKLMPVLQDAQDKLKEATARRRDIEENKNKLVEKLGIRKAENESLQQECTDRQEELAKLRRNDSLWSDLESEHMMRVEREVLQLRKQHNTIDGVNRELQMALNKIDEMLAKVDRLRKNAPEQYQRLRTECSQLRRLTQSRRNAYQRLAGEIHEAEEETATDVMRFERRLRDEEGKLTALENKLRDMLLNFEVFFEEVESKLQTD